MAGRNVLYKRVFFIISCTKERMSWEKEGGNFFLQNFISVCHAKVKGSCFTFYAREKKGKKGDEKCNLKFEMSWKSKSNLAQLQENSVLFPGINASCYFHSCLTCFIFLFFQVSFGTRSRWTLTKVITIFYPWSHMTVGWRDLPRWWSLSRSPECASWDGKVRLEGVFWLISLLSI